jgi:hypothetical protein
MDAEPPRLTSFRQIENSPLEQRLLAMEQKLLSLEQDKRSDRPSPHGVDAHGSASPLTQADQEPEAARAITGSSDPGDAVDGMVAVALKDGADEDEYFGMPRAILPLPSRNSS